MEILTFIHRNSLWLAWPLVGLGVVLLWTGIATAVRLGDRNRIASLPLAPEQVIDFPEAGEVVLWLEGPQMTTRFGGLSFELQGSDGSVLRGAPVLMRSRVARVSQVRISDRTFTIPVAGRYTLRVGGLGEPQAGDRQHALIFMRPHRMATIKAVVGIVLGAILVVGSLVGFFLRLTMGAGE